MIDLIKKINLVLTTKDKRRLIPIYLIILGNAVLDMISVAIVLPVVTLLSEGEAAIEGNLILRVCSNIFSTREPTRLSVIVLILLLVFCVLKTAYGLFYTYVINRFSLNYSRRMTRRLMEAFLSFPYEYHLDHNSSLLIRKSTYDADRFLDAVKGLLNLLSTFATSLLLLSYLIYTNWIISLIVMGLLIIFAVIVVFSLKPKIKRIAKKVQTYNSNNYKFLSQAFNGIKESKIGNNEKYFVDAYDDNRKKIVSLSLKKSVLDSIPHYFIELVGMMGVTISLSVVILLGQQSSAQIIETFAVFVYAVIKLLPAISTITSVFNSLNYYKVSVDSLYEDLVTTSSSGGLTESASVEPMPFEREIKLENVEFFYTSASDKIIFSEVNLSIQKNTSVAFSGASGAGKTTIIDVILGLLPCREGLVKCDDVDIETNMRGWHTNISYVPQTVYLSDDTIRNNVAFGIRPENINDAFLWECLGKAQLKEYVQGLPKGLDTVIGERGVRMSGGQRQRLGIARAFYRNTNIIVLDEATSALDFETEKSILDHVSQYSKDHTLIIITHRLNTIEGCDHIYKVGDGMVNQLK